MENCFAHRSNGARIMDVRTQIRPVINPAQYPFGVRHKPEKPESNAIRRRAVNRKTLLAPWFDPDSFVPGYGVTNARLWFGGRDNNR